MRAVHIIDWFMLLLPLMMMMVVQARAQRFAMCEIVGTELNHSLLDYAEIDQEQHNAKSGDRQREAAVVYYLVS